MCEAGNQIIIIKLPVPPIHLGYLSCELLHVPLTEAAHDVQLSQLAMFLALRHLQDHVYAFLFGVAYEPAGIDYCYLAFGVGSVVYAGVSGNLQPPHDALGIHEVLRAPEGDDIYLRLVHVTV